MVPTCDSWLLQAGDDPVAAGLKSDADATLFSKLLASLNLKAEEEKTSGTWFVPTDRVRGGSPGRDLG
jgi:hypothetical protein